MAKNLERVRRDNLEWHIFTWKHKVVHYDLTVNQC